MHIVRRKIYMKITNKKEGISLIVLVVTIIVLAILAAVVITSITEVNIINQATNATKDYSQKSEEEQYMLDGYLDFFNNGGSTEGNGGASRASFGGYRHYLHFPLSRQGQLCKERLCGREQQH